MAESVVAQVKDIPGTALDSVKKTPVLAIGISLLVLTLVLLIEAFKPGIITGPIRRMLRAVGVKTA